jgi:hypothetical protein
MAAVVACDVVTTTMASTLTDLRRRLAAVQDTLQLSPSPPRPASHHHEALVPSGAAAERPPPGEAATPPPPQQERSSPLSATAEFRGTPPPAGAPAPATPLNSFPLAGASPLRPLRTAAWSAEPLPVTTHFVASPPNNLVVEHGHDQQQQGPLRLEASPSPQRVAMRSTMPPPQADNAAAVAATAGVVAALQQRADLSERNAQESRAAVLQMQVCLASTEAEAAAVRAELDLTRQQLALALQSTHTIGPLSISSPPSTSLLVAHGHEEQQQHTLQLAELCAVVDEISAKAEDLEREVAAERQRADAAEAARNAFAAALQTAEVARDIARADVTELRDRHAKLVTEHQHRLVAMDTRYHELYDATRSLREDASLDAAIHAKIERFLDAFGKTGSMPASPNPPRTNGRHHTESEGADGLTTTVSAPRSKPTSGHDVASQTLAESDDTDDVGTLKRQVAVLLAQLRANNAAVREFAVHTRANAIQNHARRSSSLHRESPPRHRRDSPSPVRTPAASTGGPATTMPPHAGTVPPLPPPMPLASPTPMTHNSNTAARRTEEPVSSAIASLTANSARYRHPSDSPYYETATEGSKRPTSALVSSYISSATTAPYHQSASNTVETPMDHWRQPRTVARSPPRSSWRSPPKRNGGEPSGQPAKSPYYPYELPESRTTTAYRPPVGGGGSTAPYLGVGVTTAGGGLHGTVGSTGPYASYARGITASASTALRHGGGSLLPTSHQQQPHSRSASSRSFELL